MALQRINLHPRMTHYLVDELKAFTEEPLIIFDVGVRGGFESHWRVYGEQAKQIGFEPDETECNRLNQESSKQNRKNYPVALGKTREKRLFYVCQWEGSSSFYPANTKFLQRFPQDSLEQMQVVKTVELETISLTEFTEKEHINYIDFIKLDVEGSELDILQGASEILPNVLELSIEVLFHSNIRNQPSFSEIDLFLNSSGFQLFDLAIYRQARKALPFPTDALGSTKQGQVLWGQALYLRDAVSELELEEKKQFWSATKVLKLASMMELFHLTDCAVELIQTAINLNIFTEQLESLVNYLTPLIRTKDTYKSLSYQEYLKIYNI